MILGKYSLPDTKKRYFFPALFVSYMQLFVKLTPNKVLQLTLGLVEICQTHRASSV